MHPYFNIQSDFLRRTAILLISPILFFLFFLVRLVSAIRAAFPDFRDTFMSIWNGIKQEDELLPCPFCGGKCNPDGWVTMSGASGPSCTLCGATAYNGEAWNRRAGD